MVSFLDCLRADINLLCNPFKQLPLVLLVASRLLNHHEDADAGNSGWALAFAQSEVLEVLRRASGCFDYFWIQLQV